MSTKKTGSARDLRDRLRGAATARPLEAAEAEEAESEGPPALSTGPVATQSAPPESSAQVAAARAVQDAAPVRMKRLTLDITHEQHTHVKRWGARNGVSAAESIRVLFEMVFEQPELSAEVIERVHREREERLGI